MNAYELNGATLAYLGDAVIELMVRQYLIESGITELGKLNTMAKNFVKATAQSDAITRIEDILTEKEADMYKRGRNTHGISSPKSASVAQYRRATGFEALFAYLYMNDQKDRMKFLFCKAFDINNDNLAAQESEDRTI